MLGLGLCTDEFNPFGGRSTPYSCWLVFVTPYNLPPSLCMKRQNLFLPLLIPGPMSLGQNLDVYLRPLIDELKILWDDGVLTYNAHKKQNFNMKVVFYGQSVTSLHMVCYLVGAHMGG